MNVPFNINQSVRVKLTPLGRAKLQAEYEEFSKKWGKHSDENYIPHAPDEYGYSKFQLWDLMQTFGEDQVLAKPLMFETEIILLTHT